MAQSIDWLPHARLEILLWAEAWCTLFMEEVKDDKGQLVTKAVLWGIPQAVVSALMLAFDAARNALRVAQNEETRTKVSNRACENTFKELVRQMRMIKRKYLTVPPLTEEDIISLKLRLPDTNPTASGEPTVQIRISPYLTGAFGEVGVAFEAIRGDLRDSANKEIRVYYVIVGPGGPIPQGPEDLTQSVTMRRKKEALKRLGSGVSGKTLYMASRAENGQEKGPWGPMASVIIP